MAGVRARPAILLAASSCLAVSAVLEEAPFTPRPEVEARLTSLYSSMAPLTPDPSWDWVLKSLWYATVYGGVVLVHRCDPVVPISRTYVSEKISVLRGGPARDLSDQDVLRAWAKIWSGAEREGLEDLAGGAVWPEGVSWAPGGAVRFAFRGIVY